jgi:hypothetical protein
MPFFGMPLCLTGFFSAAASGIIDLDSRLCGRACFMHRRSAAHERENLKAYKILAAKVLLKPPAAASWCTMSGQRVQAKKYGAMKPEQKKRGNCDVEKTGTQAAVGRFGHNAAGGGAGRVRACRVGCAEGGAERA